MLIGLVKEQGAKKKIQMVKIKDSLNNIGFIKVFLMVLIVLYHSFLFLNGNWFDAVSIDYHPVPSYICQWINTFSIQTFTFLAGFIFFYKKNEKGAYNKFGSFGLNKFKRLLIPYFFILCVWVVPIYVAFYGWNTSLVIQKFVLGESPHQLWYLSMLFVVFLIFWPLSNIFKKKWGLFLALLFVATSLLGNHFLPNYFQIWTSFRFLFFFYLGYITRYRFGNFLKKIPFYLFIILDVIIFVGLIFVGKYEGLMSSLIEVILTFILNCVGVFMVWTTFDFIGDRVPLDSSKIVNFLSQRNMIVYMIHQQFIFVSIYFLYERVNLYVLGLINFVTSLIVSLLIATILLKFNLTRFLVGEKPLKRDDR